MFVSVNSDASQVAVTMFAAPCQGASLLCVVSPSAILNTQILLAAGEYSLAVDLLDPTEPFELNLTADSTL